ncbi:hypothetical protein H2201_002880 [Coniosporium apollinis]|uniref:HNH nuclease domain-containing protein n=1 Tax=Coniosporium apollinis TaxID=61459 RepID=A0ABQ9P0E4_9PEZI|nr:hypothetical protein H2201_002880 [Coniosporium apollinis]
MPDKVLLEYRKWSALYLASIGQGDALVLDQDALEDVNDELLIPRDTSKQLEFACRYFIQVSLLIRPGRSTDNQIRVETTTPRNRHLRFCLATQKEANALSRRIDYNTSTEQCIRLMANEHGALNTTPYNKVYFGRAELLDRPDADMD